MYCQISVWCRPRGGHMCECASTSPGMIVLPCTSIVRAPAGGLREPCAPIAVIRLPVTRTSPRAITSSPFIVIRRAPLRSTDPLGLARGSSTTTVVCCGSVASSVCLKNWAPSAQVIVAPSLDHRR
jgi:hypothetical protein